MSPILTASGSIPTKLTTPNPKNRMIAAPLYGPFWTEKKSNLPTRFGSRFSCVTISTGTSSLLEEDMASNAHPLRPSVANTKFSDNVTMLWYQKGGNPENNQIPLFALAGVHSIETTDRQKCTQTQHRHPTQILCLLNFWSNRITTWMQDSFDWTVHSHKATKAETMQFLIHSLIFIISSTAQAPTSLLLPKSTSSVVLAEYHHNRSQNLADCQSQRKRTNNQPILLLEFLPNRLTVI